MKKRHSDIISKIIELVVRGELDPDRGEEFIKVIEVLDKVWDEGDKHQLAAVVARGCRVFLKEDTPLMDRSHGD